MWKKIFVKQPSGGGELHGGHNGHQVNPETVYTDYILRPNWLNFYCLMVNTVYGHFYCDIINAVMMSRKTQAIKRLQLKQDEDVAQILDEFRLDDIDELRMPGMRHRLTSTSSSSLSSSLNSRHKIDSSGQANTSGETSAASFRRLSTPHRSKFLFCFFMCSEIILIIRFILITCYLSDRFAKQTMVTTTQPSGSLKYEAIKFDRPVRLIHEPSWQSSQSPNSCLREFESHFNDKFGHFYLWEARVGLDLRNESNLLFNNEHIRFRLLLEEEYAIQMIRSEVQVYTYLLACFLISCLAGCLIAGRIPYDITPLMLIFDPELTSFIVRLRMNRYLEIMRRSYLNFWSAYNLNDEGNLVYKSCAHDLSIRPTEGRIMNSRRLSFSRHSPLAGQECEQTSPGKSDRAVVDNVCLNYSQFHNYMPTVRGQSWRRVLMIAHPGLHNVSFIFVVVTILSLWLIFVQLNAFATITNRELRTFLQDRVESPDLLQIRQDCELKLNKSIDLDRLRAALVHNYADSLRSFNPVLYEKKRRSYLNWTYPSGEFDRVDQLEVDRQVVASSLAPTRQPSMSSWIIPTCCIILPSFIAELYLVILYITLLDLCVWLVELRLKLNICAAILRHYRVIGTWLHETDQELKSKSLAPPARADATLSLLTTSFSSPCIMHDPMASKSFRETTAAAGCELPAGARELQHQSRRRADGREICNVSLLCIIKCILADPVGKERISDDYAQRLIDLDLSDPLAPRKATHKFLISTYLDFRLFLDQIDDCRSSINFLIGYTVLTSLNIILSSATLAGLKIQFGFVAAGFALANLTLLAGGFFQSQCSKLYSPIHLVLALCTKGDKVVLHLAALWRRALVDLCGSRSKMSFRVYSLNISYALALQFNLSIISLYIIIVDRVKLG